MDITKESGDFVHFINNTVRHGFSAKHLADNSVKIEYNLGEYPFDVVFVADHQHGLWVPDYCPIGMVNRPANFAHRAHLGYLFMHVGAYNVKMIKRLGKV